MRKTLNQIVKRAIVHTCNDFLIKNLDYRTIYVEFVPHMTDIKRLIFVNIQEGSLEAEVEINIS